MEKENEILDNIDFKSIYYKRLIETLANARLGKDKYKYEIITPNKGVEELRKLYEYIYGETESLDLIRSREIITKFYQRNIANKISSERNFGSHMSLDDLKIYMQKIRSTNDIYARMHEYTHANMYTTVNYSGEKKLDEILPIFIELLSAKCYSKKKNNSDYDKLSLRRLSHTIECAKDMHAYLGIMSLTEFSSLPYFLQKDIIITDGYIRGHIFANKLLEEYEIDRFVLEDVKDVLKGRETLENFIDTYELDINNYWTLRPTIAKTGQDF